MERTVNGTGSPLPPLGVAVESTYGAVGRARHLDFECFVMFWGCLIVLLVNQP